MSLVPISTRFQFSDQGEASYEEFNRWKIHKYGDSRRKEQSSRGEQQSSRKSDPVLGALLANLAPITQQQTQPKQQKEEEEEEQQQRQTSTVVSSQQQNSTETVEEEQEEEERLPITPATKAGSSERPRAGSHRGPSPNAVANVESEEESDVDAEEETPLKSPAAEKEDAEVKAEKAAPQGSGNSETSSVTSTADISEVTEDEGEQGEAAQQAESDEGEHAEVVQQAESDEKDEVEPAAPAPQSETEESEELDVTAPRSSSEEYRKVAKLADGFWSVCAEADVKGQKMNNRTFVSKVGDTIAVFGLGDENAMAAVAKLVSLLKVDVSILLASTAKSNNVDQWMTEFPNAKLYHSVNFDTQRVSDDSRLEEITSSDLEGISSVISVHPIQGYVTDPDVTLFDAPETSVPASEVFFLHKPSGLLVGGDCVLPYDGQSIQLNSAAFTVGEQDQLESSWRSVLALPFNTYVGYRDLPKNYVSGAKRALRHAVRDAGLYKK